MKGRSNPKRSGFLGDGGLDIFPTFTGFVRCLKRDEMFGYKMIEVLPERMDIG